MNVRSSKITGVAAIVSVALLSASLASCAPAGDTPLGDVSITYLTQVEASSESKTQTELLVEAFEKKNPNITVEVVTIPAGTEGDNLVKTRLSTGTMEDVFHYNSGALLQALNPDSTLVDLSGEQWFNDLKLQQTYVDTVKGENGVYGAPMGTSQSGGVLYNKKIYAELGLEVPADWEAFIANSEAIKADGRYAPIEQTFADTWTAQLFVLGDFANVTKQQPDWAAEYTANKAKFVDEPALQSFDNQREVFDKGLLNEDFASAKFDDGIKAIATGTAAHYPMLTGALGAIVQNYPENLEDVGYFATPAQDASITSATVWQPNANYIPVTTTGNKLAAAKLFIEFFNTAEGCDIQNQFPASGPYVTTACTLPDEAPAALRDLQVYFDNGNIGSALEFISPVKGPNLPAITVQVGSGISTGEEGAALYDEDVKKQAQQLGLEGW